jgi:hypothetical protein
VTLDRLGIARNLGVFSGLSHLMPLSFWRDD